MAKLRAVKLILVLNDVNNVLGRRLPIVQGGHGGDALERSALSLHGGCVVHLVIPHPTGLQVATEGLQTVLVGTRQGLFGSGPETGCRLIVGQCLKTVILLGRRKDRRHVELTTREPPVQRIFQHLVVLLATDKDGGVVREETDAFLIAIGSAGGIESRFACLANTPRYGVDGDGEEMKTAMLRFIVDYGIAIAP